MTTIVSILFYLVVFVWSVFYFLLMIAIFVLTVLFDRERAVLHIFSRFWARSLVYLNPVWKLRVTGKEYVESAGRYVVTVNHQSMLDIPLMYALPKINFKWVAKQFVYKIPVFGQVLWMHGDIVVADHPSVRKAREFMDKSLERLSRGTSIIIFPEGTRSKDGEIHNFKEGAFALAKEAGVEILPCVMNGMKDCIKGWRVQPTVFEISIMPPVSVAEVQQTPTREMMSEVRTMSVDELARLRAGS